MPIRSVSQSEEKIASGQHYQYQYISTEDEIGETAF